jgi:hypothetical protein
MPPDRKPLWLETPEDHNYPAAESYLGLVFSSDEVVKLVAALQGASVTEFKAKDVFRASGLSLLGVSNGHVDRDRKKIDDGKELSPLLLVRDRRHRKVIVADGYHRLCAVYSVDEDASIPCKIVNCD